MIERGEHVILTDHGRPVAIMIPYSRTHIVHDLSELREAVLTDEAIVDAVRESREDEVRFESAP